MNDRLGKIKEMNQISVIVPVYNVCEYVVTCVNSIVGQEYDNLDIILIDDGSTDGSGEICDRFARDDDRVRVVHKQNGGLSSARNVGLDHASGDWITFVDSDDVIEQGTLERYLAVAIEHSCEIAVCNIIRIYDIDNSEPFYKPADKISILDGADRLDTVYQPSVCNKLFRSDLFEGIRFPEGRYYEDTYVYYKLAHRAGRIGLTGSDDYLYRFREESIIGNKKFDDKYFDFVEAVYEMVKYMINNNEKGFASESCLSMYAAVSNAEKCIRKTETNSDSFDKMRKEYSEIYEYIIKSPDISLKQKCRSIILKYVPAVHSRIV